MTKPARGTFVNYIQFAYLRCRSYSFFQYFSKKKFSHFMAFLLKASGNASMFWKEAQNVMVRKYLGPNGQNACVHTTSASLFYSYYSI